MERIQAAMLWWKREDVTRGDVVMMEGVDMNTRDFSKRRIVASLLEHISKVYLPREDGIWRSWTRRRRRINSLYRIATLCTFASRPESHASASHSIVHLSTSSSSRIAAHSNLSYEVSFHQSV